VAGDELHREDRRDGDDHAAGVQDRALDARGGRCGAVADPRHEGEQDQLGDEFAGRLAENEPGHRGHTAAGGGPAPGTSIPATLSGAYSPAWTGREDIPNATWCARASPRPVTSTVRPALTRSSVCSIGRAMSTARIGRLT